MSRIAHIEAQKDYCLLVMMENGSSIMLNFKNRISTVRFRRLSDQAFFQTAATDGDTIRWGDEIEISINEVFLLAQK